MFSFLECGGVCKNPLNPPLRRGRLNNSTFVLLVSRGFVKNGWREGGEGVGKIFIELQEIK
jgi:hypothetical protein